MCRELVHKSGGGRRGPRAFRLPCMTHMRILALETTERTASVAAAEHNKVLVSLPCDSTLRSAQSLAPAIGQLLRTVHWEPRSVELVAVSVGPGSFTGLRVGLTTAKLFAYAVGAEILGIDTLEVVAAAAPSGVEQVWAAMDAQRGQWVVQQFGRSAEGWQCPRGPASLVVAESWLEGLPPGSAISGPVLHKVLGRLPREAQPLPAELWPPTAANVAMLASRDYAAGRRDDLWTLVPRYSRPSAAEERLRQPLER